MRTIFLAIIVGVIQAANLIAAVEMSSDIALERLMQGNQRYVKDLGACPNCNEYQRAAIKSSQNPFAIILGCSDSRVPPEIIFDQGIGDLFTVRVAGNIAGTSELESLEYAVKHMNACLIVVLGHENCGAVQAVLEDNAADFPEIARMITPAVTMARQGKQNDLSAAVKANVRIVMENIKKADVIKDILKQRNIKVVGGYYHLATGAVEIVE